ncbi:MAG: TIGR01244 family sulfur transferase [Croceibacterium sp.]
MSDFRRVTESFWASPQITLADVEQARRQGIALIVNNRPEGESDDQAAGAAIAGAAQAAGIDYCAIPVTPGGFTEQQVDAMVAALNGAQGPVLAYCRSGTRSTLLWSLAQARNRRDPREIAREAAGAGYDVTPIAALLARLAARTDD